MSSGKNAEVVHSLKEKESRGYSLQQSGKMSEGIKQQSDLHRQEEFLRPQQEQRTSVVEKLPGTASLTVNKGRQIFARLQKQDYATQRDRLRIEEKKLLEDLVKADLSKTTSPEEQEVLSMIASYASIHTTALSTKLRSSGLFSWFKWGWKRLKNKSQKEVDLVREIRSKLEAIDKEKLQYYRGYFNNVLDGALEVPSEATVKDYSSKKLVNTYREKDKPDNKKSMKTKNRQKDVLFSHRPCTQDLIQGGFGDCFFIAGMASLVAKNPDSIMYMMKDEGDTVTVRFFNNSGQPEYYRVSKNVCTRGAETTLWVQIMETAYAAFRQEHREDWEAILKSKATKDELDLGFISNGGNTRDVYFHLTGKTATVEFIKPETDKLTGEPEVLFHRAANMTAVNDERAASISEQARLESSIVLLRETQGNQEEIERQERLLQTEAQREKELGRRIEFSILSDELYQSDDFGKISKEKQVNLMKNTESAIFMLIADSIKEVDSDKKTGLKESKKTYDKDTYEAVKENIGKMGLDKFRTGGLLIATFLYDPGQINEKMLECSRLAKELSIRAVELIIGGMEKIKAEIAERKSFSGEYSKEALSVFDAIRKNVERGALITAGTREFKEKGESKGNAGETMVEGLAGKHAYTILGVAESVVNGKNVKLIKLRNPWGYFVPEYQFDVETGTMDMESSYEKTNGVFYLELSTFLDKFNHYAQGL